MISVTVPELGDASDVEVIELCVKPGDRVAVDDPLIVIESDKASLEVPRTAGGGRPCPFRGHRRSVPGRGSDCRGSRPRMRRSKKRQRLLLKKNPRLLLKKNPRLSLKKKLRRRKPRRLRRR